MCGVTGPPPACVLQVSIIPPGRGARLCPTRPGSSVYTQEQFSDHMCTMLGGRVAEQLSFFGGGVTGQGPRVT